jgi:cytochrome c-type biogenesis protein CcmH/NrfF
MSYFCDRCKEKTPDHRVSMFNAEMICRECQNLEINHSQFEKARDAILDSISRGDYEFAGIGLPDNLKVE